MVTSNISRVDRGVMDAYRLDLLRRRIVVMAVAIGVVLIGVSLLSMYVVGAANRPRRLMTLSPAIGGAMLIVVALVKMRLRAKTIPLRELLLRSTLIVVVTVLMQLPSSAITANAIEQMLHNSGLKHVQIGSLVPLLLSMFCVHFVASIIVPWSLWESARPILIIVLVAACAAPWSPDPLGATLGGLLVVALMGVPGMVVSWLRFSRLRQVVAMKWLSGRYDEVQRELAFARRLHERLFAKPITDGPVRFDYRYEPMREIGGDFVDTLREPGGAITFVLVDVTGHGVAAALAVNRLHGEIKRIVAASGADKTLADAQSTLPSRIMSALNAYISLTLADESVFATALAVRVDPVARKLDWCNAGHPPAFVRRADGSLCPLDSTAMMLGALGPHDFDGEQGCLALHEGDVLIAYTDGAIECRNAKDEELGVDGLRAIIASSSGAGLHDQIWQRIKLHRAGETEDDVLLLISLLG